MRIPRILSALIGLACAGIALTASLAFAQTSNQQPNSKKDPFFVTDPSARETASMPVPYGLVLSTRYAFSSSTDLGSKPGLTLGADVYYDTWQIGYHSEDYGNVVRVGTRSVGRDWWSGFFAEFGSGTGTLTDSVHMYPYSLFGIGMQYNISANFQGFQAGVNLSMTAGSASWGSGTSGGQSYNGNSSLYFATAIGIVYRIPIQTTSLTLGVTAFAMTRPGIGEGNNGSGVGLNASYAFNFQN